MNFAQFLTNIVMFFVRLGFVHRGDDDDAQAQEILNTIQDALNRLFAW